MTTTAAKLQQIIDAGTHPESYYDKLLPPTSAQIRRWLLLIIRKEARLLAKIQNSLRHPLLDLFFTYSAILGTHTFFVLLLPTFFWFGYGSLGRGLTLITTSGVIFTGFVKDSLCLPRPSSPPIRRLCIGSHHLEYGFPSTHTTNAVSIALFFLTHIYSIESNIMFKFVGTICLIIYCLSVVFGRIYCGMHSLTDVFAGFISAILIWWIHWSFQVHIDAFILNESWSVPVIVITLGISLVYMFPEVIDNCPCIEDCIACIGAAVGMIIGSWNFSNSRFSNNGLTIVFIWRIVMKKILLAVLPPIYKALDLIYQDFIIKKKNIYLVNRFLSDVSYLNSNEPTKNLVIPPIDVTIKLIVYTGIGWLVVDAIPVLFEIFGMGIRVL
ncbi:phosphatidic acid phosphatase type 2/haloperoxidase [Gigaspora rosea]|uniref:Phosphatidic acid phosphatase type 2/haloperoxidase n=1 Tax=Gigaspora rosea TaxID=44941 RepID=A0A397V9H8_9GLOM|nr:phosphatidic acid phosphatase type 2/haloperoxidase [Gigaspora rosea]